MRRLVLLGALGLIACNPDTESAVGGFEDIPNAMVPDAPCRFAGVDSAPDTMVFATYPDNPDYLGVARLKGETIKLVPKEVPTFDGSSFDITYEVVDYLKWQVRARSDGGDGSLQLIRDGEATETQVNMRGSCAA